MGKRFLRFWAVCLAAVLTLSVSGCAKETEEAFPQDWIRIENRQQLMEFAQNPQPGKTYVLTQNIDLGGEEWTPIAKFSGNFNGNNKTISNFTIREAVDGNAGFFAVIDGGETQAVVEDLHLENVTLSTQAQFAGMVAGTNRGLIRGCTVTGTIVDDKAGETGYLGILAGCNDGTGTVLAGENLLTATLGSENPQDQATGLSGLVTLDFPEGRSRQVPMVGKTEIDYVDQTLCWRDTTVKFENLSETEQQRRLAVEGMMRKMGTVRWTPSQEITYTANDNRQSIHSNAFLPGRTYIGVPYSPCESSLERFMTQMGQADQEGRLVTVAGLEDGIKTKSGEVSGFILNMGSDCYGAVSWAFAAGVPCRVEDKGVLLASAVYMMPNAYNTENYGVLPVGGYQVLESDRQKYDNGIDARDTRSIIARNGGATGMAEYYAQAYRGDYLIYVGYTYNAETDTWKKNGNHARLLAYEPMILRNYQGAVDLEKSYVLTHEQGDGLYDNRLEDGQFEPYKGFNLKKTSWRVDYKYTLDVLMTKLAYNSAVLPGTGYGYVPATAAAYSYEGELPMTCRQTQPVQLPDRGSFDANYLLTYAEMTITDAQGNPVYQKTAYLPYRTFEEFGTLVLQDLFPEAAEGLAKGGSYSLTLVAYGTGGRSCTVLDQQQFVY